MLKQLVNVTVEELKYAVAWSQYQVSKNGNQLQKVLVNGVPKTGTTWMLRMIVSVPHYQTAEVYNLRGNIEGYYNIKPGEVVHGHDIYGPELAQILKVTGIKVVLMIRDPRDQVVSHMFHIKRDKSNPWHERLRQMSDDEALLTSIKGHPGSDEVPFLGGATFWASHVKSWLDHNADMIPVKYENLLENPVNQFNQVLKYIGIKANTSLVEAIVERNRFERLSVGRRIWQGERRRGQENASSHYRKGITGDWKNFFKAEHVQCFKDVAGDILIALDYEQDYKW